MDGAKEIVRGLARSWATLSVSIAVGLAFVWPHLADAMIYERAGILAGQVWRLWTGHLVHYSLSHVFWDLVVFLGAGIWLERIAPRLARWFYLAAPPALSAVLLVGEPSLVRYAGLSGVGAGVLVLLALIQLGRDRRSQVWFWWGILLLVAAKVVVEAVSRAPLAAHFGPGIRVVPLAHLGGIACAVVAWLMARRGGSAAAERT